MLNRIQKRNLTKRDYVTLSSMIFALFFGAGNLIFPLHLGQLAGSHWGMAAVGFLVTAVLLPLLSVLAVCVTKSKGVYDIGRPLGATFAVVFMVLIHFTWALLRDTPDGHRFVHRWISAILPSQVPITGTPTVLSRILRSGLLPLR